MAAPWIDIEQHNYPIFLFKSNLCFHIALPGLSSDDPEIELHVVFRSSRVCIVNNLAPEIETVHNTVLGGQGLFAVDISLELSPVRVSGRCLTKNINPCGGGRKWNLLGN